MLQKVAPALFVILWSSGFVGAKYGLPYAPPLHFLSLRYACVIVVAALLALMARASWPRDRRTLGHIAFAGLLIQAGYLGGVFVAIHAGLSAGVTALVVGMQPLLTATLAGRWLGESVSRGQWSGLALGFVGVALVASQRAAGGISIASLTPALFALAAITGGTLWQKRHAPQFDLRSGAVIQFGASLLATLPIALLAEHEPIVWSPHFFFALGWLVFVLSIGAIGLLNILLREGSAVNVARLFYLTPPTTALMAWLVFDERLGAVAICGMAIAALGVWLARAR
ncbi:DMT family transporter [Niveibacterium sp. SC-1]|uniref:DMT family transporter n=1 Tax=Niveibacterium sp. SC-1 TaxID=3135646 RepID=UPI00311ED88E